MSSAAVSGRILRLAGCKSPSKAYTSYGRLSLVGQTCRSLHTRPAPACTSRASRLSSTQIDRTGASLSTRFQTRPFASEPQRPPKPNDDTSNGTKSNQTPSKPPLVERIKSLTPHENIYTIPNILTFSRLAAAPLIGYLILHDQHAWAAGLFAYAGVTDLVDGWIARRFNQQTVVGTVIDPMADKTLMTILTVTLAIKGALPGWCATIIIGRDVLLAISAIYYRWISLPPPKTFARYWDFSLPSAEVRPTEISKINTALQLGLIGWTVSMPMLAGLGIGPGLETALVGMQYLVASTTIWSGLSYVYSKDAVKILSQEDIEERQRTQSGKQEQDEKKKK